MCVVVADAECIVSIIVLLVSRLEKDAQLTETARKLALDIGKQVGAAHTAHGGDGRSADGEGNAARCDARIACPGGASQQQQAAAAPAALTRAR